KARRGAVKSQYWSNAFSGDYELGLAIFETYNTIPNVNESNNKFYFAKDDAEITIPKGSYEVRDISEFLKRAIYENVRAVTVSMGTLADMISFTRCAKSLSCRANHVMQSLSMELI
ncbi:hypothetical protein ALC57_15714, partial [Trachymyrmex cornetzi]